VAGDAIQGIHIWFGLMYRRKNTALTLLWTDSHFKCWGTFVGADLNLSRSSASWSVSDRFHDSGPVRPIRSVELF